MSSAEIDNAHLEAAQALRCFYEPIVNYQRGEIIDLRHEVKRLKIYEEFVLGRRRQYGALSRMRLRK